MIHKHHILRHQSSWLGLGVIAVVAVISLTNARAKLADESRTYGSTTGWKTDDGTRPDYVPDSSWLDEHGRIVDRIDYPFVDDPDVVGAWTAVALDLRLPRRGLYTGGKEILSCAQSGRESAFRGPV